MPEIWFTIFSWKSGSAPIPIPHPRQRPFWLLLRLLQPRWIV